MKVILVLEDENRNACNILLAELNKRAWWDPMGIFPGIPWEFPLGHRALELMFID